MKGSRYCYPHSLGRFRGIPILKNATFHAILGITGIVVSLWFGLIPNRQQKQQTEIARETKRGVEAIKEMLESVERRESERLLEKYPEGYVLFAVDASLRKTESVIPRNSRISEEYEFAWDRVGVRKVTSTVVTIKMPDILYKPNNGRFIGTTMGIGRRPLAQEHRFPVKPKGSIHGVFVELVEDSDSRFAFAIGFRKE